MQKLLKLRLVKFCIVGASSTVINLAILAVLLDHTQLSMPVSQTIGFIFGVLNGFYWNRRWTFAGSHEGSLRRQLPMFFATNIVGLLLNLVITQGFLFIFTGKMMHNTKPDTNTGLLATICAIPIVVIWNFGASRFWTFKQPKTQSTVS